MMEQEIIQADVTQIVDALKNLEHEMCMCFLALGLFLLMLKLIFHKEDKDKK